MPKSEVAQLRGRIEAECKALHHLSLFASTASHRTISTRYRNLERYHDQLKMLTGEERATSMIVDIYNQYI